MQVLKLKLILLISIMFCVFSQTSAEVSLHAYSDTVHLSTGVYEGNDLNPGDTLILETGLRDQLLFKNIIGTSENPIIVLNGQGETNIKSDSGRYGIAFRGSRYFKITGTGDESIERGIVISKVGISGGVGLTLEKLSRDFEVDHLEITDIPFAAIIAKTDPDSTLTSCRDSFLLSNAIFHDNYIHDIHGGEGFYIGHSRYKTGSVLSVNGKDTVVMPHLLSGVKVYDNIIENTGLDGIQVSSTTTDCDIYNNRISHDSQTEEYGQMSGIIVGGGSRCDCYNNRIFNGKGTGILMLGLGNSMLYNNLIVNAGLEFQPDDSLALQHGIYLNDKTLVDGSSFHIFNNTIISPKSDGIRFTSSKSQNNRFYNNLIVAPGSYDNYIWDNTSLKPADSYVYISNSDLGHVDTIRNFGFRYLEDAPLIYTEDKMYELQDSSFLIDGGTNVAAYGVNFDINNKPRPQGHEFDVGAFESDISNDGAFPEKVSIVNAYPNPAKENITIKFELDRDGFVNLFLVDLQGRLVEKIENGDKLRGTYTHTIDLTNHGHSMMIIFFEFEGKIHTRRIVRITHE